MRVSLFSDTVPPTPRKDKTKGREDFVQEQLQISIEPIKIPMIREDPVNREEQEERGVVVIDVF
jgi:hypothetical protein